MRKFDAEKFLRDNRIPVADLNHKHHRDGWINIECRFCSGNPGYHLGFSTSGNTWNCHRCGSHGNKKVIAAVLSVSIGEAEDILRQYSGRPVRSRKHKAIKRGERKLKNIKFPMGTGPMKERHLRYLEKRGFTDEVIQEWGLMGTGPIGPYKHRIIIPIHRDGYIVSYQGRDITDRASAKYKACPQELEAIPHKETLYGLDGAEGSNTVIITEGVTDVWRLGSPAVATFGIKFTTPQVKLLKGFERRIILFDSDPQAQEQAEELANLLGAFRGETVVVTTDEGDPGSWEEGRVKDFKRRLLL